MGSLGRQSPETEKNAHFDLGRAEVDLDLRLKINQSF